MKLNPKAVPALVLATLLAACGGTDAGAGPVAVAEAAQAATTPADVARGSWEPVARSPLAARNNAVTTWTGKEVLVFGGETFHCGGPMYGSFSCAAPTEPPLRDGAAYDPAKDSWRRIARAPVPMLYASTAVVDDEVFVLLSDKDFFAYSLPDDRWTRLSAPPGYSKLVAVGDLLVAYRQTSKEGRGRG